MARLRYGAAVARGGGVLDGTVMVAMGSVEPSHPGIETRVHGVGNHDLLSALGSPKVLRPGSARTPALVEPPESTDHELVLLNWSRMSRSAPTFLWYLAFPFTLVNLAHATQPVEPTRRLVHRAVVWLVGAALTTATAVWVLVMTERLLILVDLPDAVSARRAEVAAVVATAALCLPMLVRALRRPESPSHLGAALAHALVVIGVCLAAYSWRPAQGQVDPDGPWRVFASEGPSDAQLADRLQDISLDPRDFPLWLDVVALSAYGSLLIAVVGAVALGLIASRSRYPAPARAAALACLLAGAILNLLASSTLIGLSQIVARSQGAWWIPVFGAADLHDPSGTIVMGRFTESYGTKLVAGVSAVLILLFAISLVVTTRPTPVRWKRSARGAEEVGRWAHGTVRRLPEVLSGAVYWSALPALPLFVAVYALMVDRYEAFTVVDEDGFLQPAWPPVYGWISYGVVLLSLGVFLTVRRADRFQPLREGLALIADVAGFWAITVHPLGARTYRPDVVGGVLDALERAGDGPSVLVGHSQGSVICAWALARPESDRTFPRRPRPAVTPALVTCGSPLQSLYATVFPRHFDDRFFTRVGANARGWVNCWRTTDPIATEIDSPAVRNVPLEDPAPGTDGRARCHGDYWIDDTQKQSVEELLARGPQPVAAALDEPF